MMDPLTWTIIGTLTAAAGIGTAVTGGIIGAVEQHNAAKQSAQNAEDNAIMQQQQMEYNKRMEEREAAAIEAENAENARRKRLESERLRSAQMALLGKSGAAITSGSPLAILGQTAADEELKIQDIRYGGARAAAAHRSKATDYGYGSAIAGQNVLAAKASRPTSTALGAAITGEVGSGVFKLGQLTMNAASGYNAIKKG